MFLITVQLCVEVAHLLWPLVYCRLVSANDIIKSLGESPVRMELKRRTYARGHTPSVGATQQKDSPRKVSKSDNPLTPSKPVRVPVRQDIIYI